MFRPLRTLAVVLSATLAAAFLVPAQASAGVLDATCTPPSSLVLGFSPPLTLAPQTVTTTRTFQFGPCISASVPGLTSGSSVFISTVPGRSCLDLLGSRPATIVISWNTGQTSTISGKANSTVAGAVFQNIVTGTISSGLFAGDTVVLTNTGVATDITLCTLGLGTVSNIYTTSVLEITSI